MNVITAWLGAITLLFWYTNPANAKATWILSPSGVREYRLEHGKVYNTNGKCLYKYNNGTKKFYNCKGKFLLKYTGNIMEIIK